jgi:hypothetical protein
LCGACCDSTNFWLMLTFVLVYWFGFYLGTSNAMWPRDGVGGGDMYTLTHLCRGKIEKRVRKRVGMSRNVRIQQTANKKIDTLLLCRVISQKQWNIWNKQWMESIYRKMKGSICTKISAIILPSLDSSSFKRTVDFSEKIIEKILILKVEMDL